MDPYSVFLAIATHIPVLLMTGFVVQGHIQATAKLWPCTAEDLKKKQLLYTHPLLYSDTGVIAVENSVFVSQKNGREK